MLLLLILFVIPLHLNGMTFNEPELNKKVVYGNIVPSVSYQPYAIELREHEIRLPIFDFTQEFKAYTTKKLIAALRSTDRETIDKILSLPSSIDLHMQDEPYVSYISLGLTPLMIAILGGDLISAQRLIALGTDLTARSGSGMTPLAFAAIARPDTAMVTLLLKHGAHPNEPYIADYKESKKRFPLTVAALLGHADIVAMLLEAGANPCAASAQKCENTLQLLHSQQTFASTPEQAHDFARIIAQFQAALQHHKVTAQPQIKAQAPQRKRSTLHGGLLLTHLMAGYFEMAEAFLNNLRRIIDLSVASSEGATALMIALTKGQMTLVRLIIAQSTPHDINMQMHDTGITALHLAVQNNNVEAVRLLLQAGADTTLLDCHNFTPLEVARLLKQSDIIALFAMHRPTPPPSTSAAEEEAAAIVLGIQTSFGKAIQQAVFSNDLPLLKQCIAQNRQALYELDDSGTTMLDWAIHERSMTIVKFLIEEHYFDPNTLSTCGMTPFQTAIIFDNVEVVHYLLEREGKKIITYEPKMYRSYIRQNEDAQPGSPQARIRDLLLEAFATQKN